MIRGSELIPRLGVLVALAVILGVPWLFRPESARVPDGAQRLVIITPHNEQIRSEFAAGFDRWHRQHFGAPVVIDWRAPGGTSEIRRLLIAQYTAALRTGRITPQGELRPGAEPMPYDLLFGGGSYEHGEIKRGVRAAPPGTDKEIALPISAPLGLPAEKLDELFGENLIGVSPLYDPGDPSRQDPGQHWLACAVSGFGIVFNRPVLRRLGLGDPTTWAELTDPRLMGWVALADPRQSGSVATTYESILNSYDWDDGWRILRAMSANARYFSNSSQKVPLDVSQGQAAVGTAIDFYGRYQSQAMMKPGETPDTARVGYVDPPGVVFIDPDPISLLRGGPNEQLARRFIDFTLSLEGQALWNFPARGEQPGLGPARFELRRMPIRRVMYTDPDLASRLVDKVNPYEAASRAPNRGWRSAINPMMGAFSIDIHDEQRQAWAAIDRARARGADPDLVRRAEELFFAWPTHVIPPTADTPAQTLPFTKDTYKAIRADWREAEKDGRMPAIRIAYTSFFRDSYRTIVRMLDETHAPGVAHAPATGAAQ
ncbi:MAG: ABC transporter substrate-binding protein [Planctomycetota bacterium]|nr:ABC transporter substrate-binding protein [Planctomycetota bacterium]